MNPVVSDISSKPRICSPLKIHRTLYAVSSPETPLKSPSTPMTLKRKLLEASENQLQNQLSVVSSVSSGQSALSPSSSSSEQSPPGLGSVQPVNQPFKKRRLPSVDTEEDKLDSITISRPLPVSGTTAAAVSTAGGAVATPGKHGLCEVCGDRASGQHYGVPSCEGCKGFFRRTIEKAHTDDEARSLLKCKHGGNCGLNPSLRNSCGPCRLKGCYMSGMNRTSSKLGRRPKNRKEEPVQRPQMFREEDCVAFLRRMYKIFKDETRKSGSGAPPAAPPVSSAPAPPPNPLFSQSAPTFVGYQTHQHPQHLHSQLPEQQQIYLRAVAEHESNPPVSNSTSVTPRGLAHSSALHHHHVGLSRLHPQPAQFHPTAPAPPPLQSAPAHLPSPVYPPVDSMTSSDSSQPVGHIPFDPTALFQLASQDAGIAAANLLTVAERELDCKSLVHLLVDELQRVEGNSLRQHSAARLHCAFILYAKSVLRLSRSDPLFFSNEHFVEFMRLAQFTRDLLLLPENTVNKDTPKRLANELQSRLLRQVNSAQRQGLLFLDLNQELPRLGPTVYKVIESYQNAQMWLLNPKRKSVIQNQLDYPGNRITGEKSVKIFLNHLSQICMRAIRFFMWLGTGNVDFATRASMVRHGVMGLAALALMPLFDFEKNVLYEPLLCYCIPLDQLNSIPMLGPFLEGHMRMARQFHLQQMSPEEWALLSSIYLTRPKIGNLDQVQAVKLHSMHNHFIKAFLLYVLVRRTFGFWPDARQSANGQVWSVLTERWTRLTEQQRTDIKLEARHRFTLLTNPLNCFRELEELHQQALGPVLSGSGSKLHSEIYAQIQACLGPPDHQNEPDT